MRHKIGQGNLKMYLQKAKAIHQWSAPVNVRKLRSFLGLTDYYQHFISCDPYDKLFEEGIQVELSLEMPLPWIMC